MKQQSGLRLTIIAVICGIAAAALTVFYLKQVETKYRKASMPQQQVMVTVVVPNQDLKKGSVITPKLVAARKVPQEFLPSNAILAEDFKKVMNRTLLMPLQIGRPITWEAVTGKSAKTYSETIELGRRSRSVKVNKIDSFDGLLRPGDRIDLMGNFTLSSLGLAQAAGTSSTPENIVMPILENVEVLAAGKEDMYGRKYEYSDNRNSADGFNMDFTIVGLNLTPKQIARVEISEGVGDMFAVLRHPKDTSVADFKYVGVELLFEKDEPANIDVVMGADGKAIGTIVGDNIVDENGNIVGKIVNGQAVSFDGKPLGKIVENVSADDPMLNVAEVVDVVRDANGQIIGKIVDGQIIDENGNVVGEIKDGQAVSLTGEIIGTVDKGVALDLNGNEIDLSTSAAASITSEVVRDADGNVIGTIVNGKVVDAEGNVIGVVKDGKVVDIKGNVIADDVSVSAESASADVVVRDADGNVIGTIVNGKVVDANGKVIGEVKDGKVVDMDGNVIAEGVVVAAETANAKVVVRDADGNVIGTIVNGQVVDATGKVIGVVKDGKVVDMDGKVIAENVSIKAESPAITAVEKGKSQYEIEFVDFISGGTGEDGIIPVTKVRKE
ncbi:MAG: Flp pilus assembly protein CpaB [Methylophagaceae bacterium]|jgi:Flp pilus assembly protein CpaB